MSRLLLEISCPKHGFERFSIKIVRRYNIPSKKILPNFTEKSDRLSQLYVGRNVTDKEIKKFFNNYLSRTGMKELVLTMQLVKGR